MKTLITAASLLILSGCTLTLKPEGATIKQEDWEQVISAVDTLSKDFNARLEAMKAEQAAKQPQEKK